MKWNLEKKKKMALNLEGNIKDQISKSTYNELYMAFNNQ